MSERPFVFCHMGTSLDGKIMGRYMSLDHGGNPFYRIAFGENPYYHHQGWISGRVTTDDNFTNHRKPNLDPNAAPVPEGDYVARKTGMYYISVDPRGVLGWESHVLRYHDTVADVVEVLTEQASNSYKAFLRRLGISYIVCGEKRLDMELMLQKMADLFGCDTLMLGGGAALNWSFIQAGLCDEVSVVISPAADGSTKTQTLFMEKPGLSDDTPVAFDLLDVQRCEGDCVWLRYGVPSARSRELA
ncbi:MAG: RibD family protein [Tractidigestivibacter sp.]|jgi:riboflavin biosynthesis pyrimidine reductase|uniref:RibD family protein n=1 Tax=Tractidigestivibacter sp. TaxID=2847320 RepID=UPI003D8F8E45